ncbi:MAG TPA: bifunctional adenosylcobinamide kinase/adenosylcobinamide-phosphate guanylyltransferase [Dehalococcoidia bacterium]|jgi:adenosylcobinamide kinase/adenosylcobinamide-phosphate guanylyltransferase
MALTLIIGGARSGKSRLAERLAEASGRPVLFIATMQPEDGESKSRVAAHRASRPAAWRTIEEPRDLARALSSAHAGDFVIVDCLTVWAANVLLSNVENDDAPAEDEIAATMKLVASASVALAEQAAMFDGEVAVVTNEVGAGVVPPYPLGRVFRDALGAANATLAARADRVYHVVAGLAVDLKTLGARPIDEFAPRSES